MSRPSLLGHDRMSEDFTRFKTARSLPRKSAKRGVQGFALGFNTFYTSEGSCFGGDMAMTDRFEAERANMVDAQLIPRKIVSACVLDAMRTVPRHLFVPDALLSSAYADSPLPIGFGQTVSQPYIVAYMTERLDPFPGMRVLEVGTGSGYQTAILAYLGCTVYTVELVEGLASAAQEVFNALELGSIVAKCGNGYMGWPDEAPFDAIIITAAPEAVPEGITGQLAEGGKMVVPVGPVDSVQVLKLIVKEKGALIEKDLLPVRFVPMV